MFYDSLVIGAGHAGCEAAAALARLGHRTLLITSDLQRIGEMSCNPSIGGIGKGQLVREVDALGGLTGEVTDAATIQFRMLNRSKGPAMHSPRAQCDREQFSLAWKKRLSQLEGLQLLQDAVLELLVEAGRCVGVRTAQGRDIRAGVVILACGTFLNGSIHIGLKSHPGGRIGEAAIPSLSDQLATLGCRTRRFKTGTSPRIDARSINYSLLEAQLGDAERGFFSHPPLVAPSLPQLPCHFAYTNARTHDIIRQNLEHSPLHNRIIQGSGPRYCPSIEDKIRVFASKESHQIFLEPESLYNHTVYINGFSCSLPLAIQEEAIRSIRGLEESHLLRPGYAVEYDCLDATQLRPTLESEVVHHLFIAGQLNGTTGYEEAAAQGLIAGINAHALLTNSTPLLLGRDEAYIGVMIDDLVSQPQEEPYRMFTSRAEHRLSLRNDNADQRLMHYATELGLLSPAKYRFAVARYQLADQITASLAKLSLSQQAANSVLGEAGSAPVNQGVKALSLLARPEVSIRSLLPTVTPLLDPPPASASLLAHAAQAAEIGCKYANYIVRESSRDELVRAKGHLPIPASLDYDSVTTISHEAREKLKKYRPATVAQARSVPGVKASDLEVLVLLLRGPSPERSV